MAHKSYSSEWSHNAPMFKEIVVEGNNFLIFGKIDELFVVKNAETGAERYRKNFSLNHGSSQKTQTVPLGKRTPQRCPETETNKGQERNKPTALQRHHKAEPHTAEPAVRHGAVAIRRSQVPCAAAPTTATNNAVKPKS